MLIKPVVNKLTNHYFFVSNLSEWHHSCRPQYNKLWLKKNPLSEKETTLLRRFAEIHHQYGFDERSFYLGRIFFLSDEPWTDLKARTPHHLEIADIFQAFEERFNRVWGRSKSGLLRQQKNIADFFNNQPSSNQKIINELLLFYSLEKPLCQDVTVFLLLSIPGLTGGGANLKPQAVTLECSDWSGDQKMILSVLYHELVHLCFENYDVLPEPVRSTIESSTREKIIAGLFPRGYLGQKYFQIAAKNPHSQLLEKYFTQKKTLDERLIKEIRKTT